MHHKTIISILKKKKLNEQLNIKYSVTDEKYMYVLCMYIKIKSDNTNFLYVFVFSSL